MLIWKIFYQKVFNSISCQQKYQFNFASWSLNFINRYAEWTDGNIDQYEWVEHSL
jgi:hypothetical protein